MFLSMQKLVPCDFLNSVRCGDSVVICRVNGDTNMIILCHWYNSKKQNVFPTLNALFIFLSHKFARIYSKTYCSTSPLKCLSSESVLFGYIY